MFAVQKTLLFENTTTVSINSLYTILVALLLLPLCSHNKASNSFSLQLLWLTMNTNGGLVDVVETYGSRYSL